MAEALIPAAEVFIRGPIIPALAEYDGRLVLFPKQATRPPWNGVLKQFYGWAKADKDAAIRRQGWAAKDIESERIKTITAAQVGFHAVRMDLIGDLDEYYCALREHCTRGEAIDTISDYVANRACALEAEDQYDLARLDLEVALSELIIDCWKGYLAVKDYRDYFSTVKVPLTLSSK